MINELMGTIPGSIHIAIQPSETYSKATLRPFIEKMFEGHHMKGCYSMEDRRAARAFITKKTDDFLNRICIKPKDESELIVMTQAPIEDALIIQDQFLAAAGIFVSLGTVNVLGRFTPVNQDELVKLVKYKTEREVKKKKEEQEKNEIPTPEIPGGPADPGDPVMTT